jgi:BRO family, N-terminal domain
MNPELVPFVFDGRELRIVMIDDRPWVVASDLCAILELADTRKSVASIKPKHRKKVPVLSKGGTQQTWVVSESGLYRLILRSNKPDAERFQDWICDEVLPSIRKTGKYQIGQELAVDMPFLLPAPEPQRVIFPPEFFHHLFRLMNRPEIPPHKARWIAHKIIDLIWRRIEEGVFDAITLVNPTAPAKSSGRLYRRYKLSQFVAEGKPMEKLIAFIARCTQAMSDFSSWRAFYSQWNAQYPIKRDLPHEVKVTFTDDSELLFSFMLEPGKGLP